MQCSIQLGDLQSYVIKIYRSPALMFFFAEDVGIKRNLESELLGVSMHTT